MRPADVRAYLSRDREMVERSRAEHWREVKRRHGAFEGIRIASELRKQAVEMSPESFTAAERAADLAVHERVSELLRHVRARRTA